MSLLAYGFALVGAHLGAFLAILLAGAAMRSLSAPTSDSSLYSLGFSAGPTGHLQRLLIAFARALGALLVARLMLLALRVDFTPVFVAAVVILFTIEDIASVLIKNDPALYDRARVALPLTFIAGTIAALLFLAG